MNPDFADAIGVIGGVLFVIFFWRTSVKKSHGHSIWSELDVFLASICLSYYAYSKGAYITKVLNLAWIYVAFRGVTSYVERRLSHQRRNRQHQA